MQTSQSESESSFWRDDFPCCKTTMEPQLHASLVRGEICIRMWFSGDNDRDFAKMALSHVIVAEFGEYACDYDQVSISRGNVA